LLLAELRNIYELEPYQYAIRERPNFHQVVLLLRQEYAGWDLARTLSRRGVMNSVGTFGLRPALDRGVFRSTGGSAETVVPNTRDLLARAIALIVSRGQSDDDLHRIARTLEQTVDEYRRTKESRLS
jgi:dTDP-4-amino-4,6-dideoxygalactose transaminase